MCQEQVSDPICAGCDQPTKDAVQFLFGPMCPKCDKLWDVLCNALEPLGGLSVVSES